MLMPGVVGIQIQEMPVSSAIMTPWQKEVVVHNGHIEVTGKSPRVQPILNSTR